MFKFNSLRAFSRLLSNTPPINPPIKVVNGVMGAYPGTPEYSTIEETHQRYKKLIYHLNKANFQVTVATHNPHLLGYAKANFDNINFAMLHPAATCFARYHYFPASAYIVAGDSVNQYVDRRRDEISNKGNISELQERLKESSNILHKCVGYLGELYVCISQYSPKMGMALMGVAINLKLLQAMFKMTFTSSINKVNQLMESYQNVNVTPWLSLTTLEEAHPTDIANLKTALDIERKQYKCISDHAEKPFIIGLRTWVIDGENVFDLFYNHVEQLLELPNVQRIIADWEGPDNQDLVLAIYKQLPDQSKHRFGWTLRALDATNKFLDQTIAIAE